MTATPTTGALCTDALALQAMPRIIAFYEDLKAGDVGQLSRIYAHDARFKDPFNDVRGTAAIEAIFAHMFNSLDAPRFVVRERLAGDQQIYLTWDFCFRFKGDAAQQTIHGASRLHIDASGLVSEHRDYWDAAEELYEKLPLIGALMRWLKRRVMTGR